MTRRRAPQTSGGPRLVAVLHAQKEADERTRIELCRREERVEQPLPQLRELEQVPDSLLLQLRTRSKLGRHRPQPIERTERALERFDGRDDLDLLSLVEDARDHPPKLHLCDEEVFALTLHPHFAHDSPARELAEGHAHGAGR